MRSLCFAAALVILSQLLLAAQDDKTVLNEGRIIGTTVNDQGEPIAKARLCTSIVKSNSSHTNCGPESDEHGQFDLRVPLETNRIYGQKPEGGYWHDANVHDMNGPEAGVRIKLSRENPTAHVVVKLGKIPAHLTVNISDRNTGKEVDSATVRCVVIDDMLTQPSETTKREISVPPDKDLLIIVQAPGYRRWFYTDSSSPSQPTLRLHSGEERTLDAELESN
ncbi:MAG: hypothetical protein ABSF15_19835 [Candidatus Sulfotelmatobacter sp.]